MRHRREEKQKPHTNPEEDRLLLIVRVRACFVFRNVGPHWTTLQSAEAAKAANACRTFCRRNDVIPDLCSLKPCRAWGSRYCPAISWSSALLSRMRVFGPASCRRLCRGGQMASSSFLCLSCPPFPLLRSSAVCPKSRPPRVPLLRTLSLSFNTGMPAISS